MASLPYPRAPGTCARHVEHVLKREVDVAAVIAERVRDRITLTPPLTIAREEMERADHGAQVSDSGRKGIMGS
jgi:hypothetical protein